MNTGKLDIPGLNQAVLGILDQNYRFQKAVIGSKDNGEIHAFNDKNGLFIPHTLYSFDEDNKIYAENISISEMSDESFKIEFEQDLSEYKILRCYISSSESLISGLNIVDIYINDDNYKTIYGYIGQSSIYSISDSPSLILTHIIFKDNKLCFLNMFSDSANIDDSYIIKIDAYKIT